MNKTSLFVFVVGVCFSLVPHSAALTRRWDLHLPTLFSDSGKPHVVKASEWKNNPHQHRSQRHQHHQVTKPVEPSQPHANIDSQHGSSLHRELIATRNENLALRDKLRKYEMSALMKQTNAGASAASNSQPSTGVSIPLVQEKNLIPDPAVTVGPPSRIKRAHLELRPATPKSGEYYKKVEKLMLPHGEEEWAELGEGNNTMRAAVVGIPLNTTIYVTFADAGMMEFMYNWVLHCRKAGISPLLVGAMDNAVLEATRAFGVRTFSMEHSIETFGWGAQIGIIEGLHELGYHVLMSDVDTAWVRDPTEYFEGTPARQRADLLISSDCASCQHDEEIGLCVQAPFNIGIMLWRNTEIARHILREWVENLKKQGGVGYMAEQTELNTILRGSDGKRLFPMRPVMDSKVRQRAAVLWSRNPMGDFAVGMLPAGQFTHGHLYLVSEVPQRLGLTIYVVHATYQFGNGRKGQAAGKKQRLREHGLWLADSDEYFTEGKYLVYSDVVPNSVKEGVVPGFPTHQAVTAFHFRSLMVAAGLAQALGRILVLPRWECHCDRHWTPILPGCIMANSDLKLPFHCPMDHLLEVLLWTSSAKIQVREPGFLLNPRFLQSNRTDKAYVHVGGAPYETFPGRDTHPTRYPFNAPRFEQGVPDMDIVNAEQPLSWAPFADDKEAKQRVKAAELDNVRVLEFTAIENAFCGFEEPAVERAFNHLLLGANGGDRGNGILNSLSWCCRNADPKGYMPSPVSFSMPEFFHHKKCKSRS